MAGDRSRSDGGEAGHLGVGRVGEEQVDALLAEPGERPQVGDALVERELVHLEVAGVQHQAGRRADRDGEPVRDRVVDGDELAVERAELLAPSLADLDGHRLDPVLLELGLDERQRQLGADDRDVGPLAQQVGHAADVVLVPVGQDDGLDLVQPVPDPGEVGQDHVDARLGLLREQHAAVDDRAAGRRARTPSCSGRSRRARRAPTTRRPPLASAGGGPSSGCGWLTGSVLSWGVRGVDDALHRASGSGAVTTAPRATATPAVLLRHGRRRARPSAA